MKPPSDEDRVQCSACGFWLDPKITPSGGQFTFAAGATVDGTTKELDGLRGCPFCHCPAWDAGGELGDMAHVRYGARAR